MLGFGAIPVIYKYKSHERTIALRGIYSGRSFQLSSVKLIIEMELDRGSILPIHL
ncbi:hypothetical protein RSAG8_09028, partial [Rhizoctonia solani AG-8 WAC10335]